MYSLIVKLASNIKHSSETSQRVSMKLYHI